jgi:lambda repressor-like predicted transcriptional regulator
VSDTCTTSLNRDSLAVMKPTEAREWIAAEARAALARDGRSAASLAEAAGISRSALSKKLRAQVSFSVEEIVDVALALGINPGSLVPDTTTAMDAA